MFSTDDLRIQGSRIDGLGVFAVRAIPAATRVLEYVGTRLTTSESSARNDQTFLFELDEANVVDGNSVWNPAGFINHSCAPNCYSSPLDGSIWIVTLREIAAGEELTFNYSYGIENFRSHPCHCGAPTCVGYMVAEKFFPVILKLRSEGALGPAPGK